MPRVRVPGRKYVAQPSRVPKKLSKPRSVGQAPFGLFGLFVKCHFPVIAVM